MPDPVPIPTCFFSVEGKNDEPLSVARSGQSVFISVYQTTIADQCRLITITWCKNFLIRGLSLSIQGETGDNQHNCKIQLKPWHFWRKQGSKHFLLDGYAIDIVWDLKTAKFNGKAEPRSDYYVAIVCEEEVVLLLGDLKKDAYRKTGCRPSLIDPTLVSRREHVFGKRRFLTRINFQDKRQFHDILIEYKDRSHSSSCNFDGVDQELEIRVDGKIAINVDHLQWKFRGNKSLNLGNIGVEVYWDVHDWLFASGPRYGLFIFKPLSFLYTLEPSLLGTLLNREADSAEIDSGTEAEPSRFCFSLYAWRID